MWVQKGFFIIACKIRLKSNFDKDLNLKITKRVIFASAKMVGGALKNNKSSYSIRTFLFHGAFPYPVVIKILTIFVKEGEIWNKINRKTIKSIVKFYENNSFYIKKLWIKLIKSEDMFDIYISHILTFFILFIINILTIL